MSEKDMIAAAMQVVAAEETGSAIGRELAKVSRTVEVKPQPTFIVDRKGVTINGEDTIINKQGMGVLQELMFKSESSSFAVSVWRDDVLEINGSYSDYLEISQEIDEIAVFERNGVYVLHISDIEFAESLIVKVSTTQSVRFSRIFGKYKLSA
jgi:hypothetical protein